MQTTAGEGIFAHVCSPRNWERATEGAESERPQLCSAAGAFYSSHDEREESWTGLKTSSVGFCHQWLLQYQSLCMSLWPASSSFYLFFILPSAYTSLSLSDCLCLSHSGALLQCLLLLLSAVLTLFMYVVSYYPVASICERVYFYAGELFASMLRERLGVSICKIWSDDMVAGWDLYSPHLHGLIREGTLRLSQLFVSHWLHPNRHQHYPNLLYSPTSHTQSHSLNSRPALFNGEMSL